MLSSYQTLTSQLLQNPGASTTLYPTSQLTTFINIARGQLSGESECVRVIGTLNTAKGVNVYPFSSINIGITATTGVQGIININTIQYDVASGQKWLAPRNWPWFQLYHLNNPVPMQGPPTVWSQFGQGSSGQGSITGVGTGSIQSGSFYIDPVPDAAYTLNCDCTCYPQALATDSDVEAIPYLWTDAIPWYAAWYALMSTQVSTRQQEATQYKQLYSEFVQRARQYSNSSVNRYVYQQSPDPVMANKIGQSARGAA